MFPAITSGGASPAYEIAKSLRFRGAQYLQRTFGAPTNNKKWTLSLWVKRGTLGSLQYIFNTGSNSSGLNQGNIKFLADDTLSFFQTATGSATTEFVRMTSAVFRDPSAHMHIVAVFDSDNATPADRAILYVNGVRVTSFAASTDPALGLVSRINTSGAVHTFGRYDNGTGYFAGYDSEPILVDGQALAPDAFGYFDANTKSWEPKAYTGTYGANGSYLPFNDGSNLTNLCLDRSGNGNNWTANGVSLTAGTTYDWMDDTPTNNFAVWNPLDKNASLTLVSGNLDASTGAAAWVGARSTFAMISGKWYWEVIATSANSLLHGIATASYDKTGVGQDAYGWGYWQTGYKYNNNAAVAYGAAYTTNDVVGIAFDADAGTLTFYKNGVSQGVAYSGLTSGPYFPASSVNAGSAVLNFGQRPFDYTPPAGFKALCTKNLPEPAIKNPKKHFDVKAVSASSSGGVVTGVGFQPDLIWNKHRATSEGNHLVDSIRGGNKLLVSDSTAGEYTDSQLVVSFNSDGFTYGNALNSSGATVDWLWKAGGAAVANTAGTITGQVSANPDAGFSIVSFDHQAAGSKTVGHGLGVAPKLIIIKSRNAATYGQWMVYAEPIGNGVYLQLNTSGAQVAAGTAWNNTSPTSSVFTLGSGFTSGGYGVPAIAYCFAEIPGYSRIGSYVGNGTADGPFVYCGFRPRWILRKGVTTAGVNWVIHDTARSDFNLADDGLLPNTSGVESILGEIDITANGFKVRSASFNASNETYIFMAIAETPFKYANAR